MIKYMDDHLSLNIPRYFTEVSVIYVGVCTATHKSAIRSTNAILYYAYSRLHLYFSQITKGR